MKIILVIKDLEYCKAFRNNIASVDKDVMVEVSRGGKLNGLDSKSIIVTDIEPRKVDKKLIKQIVFLTKDPKDKGTEDSKTPYRKIFKYLRTSKILAFIEETYCSLTGEMERIDSSGTRIFAVCSDSNSSNGILCKTLARQIAYRHGGEILILPLRYINDYFDPNENDGNKFSRLLYYLKSEKECVLDSYLFKDNYGISYASIGKGMNPICKLELEDVLSLIKLFCKGKFETIILDIGDCFSDTNNEIISKSDSILFIKKGINFGLEDLIISDGAINRAGYINLFETEKDFELMIDDYVSKIYEVEGNDNE